MIDVRKNPISRKAGFSKTKLEAYTKAADLEYYHLPELGIAAELRRNLKTPEAYTNLFELYETEILPKQPFALKKLKQIILNDQRVALTCFEADAQCCHRHKLLKYLQQQKTFEYPVQHLTASMLPIYTKPVFVQEAQEYSGLLCQDNKLSSSKIACSFPNE